MIVNERDPDRRASLAEAFPVAMLHGHDAKLIDDLLPGALRPSVVIMNPPFSRAEGRGEDLAEEDELGRVFDDCAVGAVPPGLGYGVATIVDEALEAQPDIYFEAGDHASLIHMDGAEFTRMMRNARHGQFSEPMLE
jgi:Ala-tRNA(Pro) deacylase